MNIAKELWNKFTGWFVETKFARFFIEAGRRIKKAWKALRGKE